MKWFRKAAAGGKAAAQFNLGIMYGYGRSVPQDHVEAVKWYRKAARQRFSPAQDYLGAMYAKGQGVPQNYILAHMWFSLAAANGSKTGSKYRDKVAKRMTSAQIAEAQTLAREWLAKHKKK